MEYILSKYNHILNTTNSLYNITPIFFWRLINGHYEDKRESIYENQKYESFYAFFAPCNHIIDNIFLGSAYNAADWVLLKKLSIECVINITEDVPNFYEKENINYFNIILKDNGKEDINLNQLNKLIDFVKNNRKKNILIHCLVGRSRSVSALCYILVKIYNFKLDKSIEYIKKKRSYANPSIRFYNNLKYYLN